MSQGAEAGQRGTGLGSQASVTEPVLEGSPRLSTWHQEGPKLGFVQSFWKVPSRARGWHDLASVQMWSADCEVCRFPNRVNL